MTESLQQLLTDLEKFGEANDSKIKDRSRRMLNITRDTGAFLAVLVRAVRARRVLEIGTSNGYSTLWLADAARAVGGRVTTVEFSEFKLELAAQTFARSGLTDVIRQIKGEAGQILADAGTADFDLIFIDSERSQYSGWWPDIRRVLKKDGLLIADNAVSHREEMAPFMTLVSADADFTTCLVPIGNGEFLASRSGV